MKLKDVIQNQNERMTFILVILCNKHRHKSFAVSSVVKNKNSLQTAETYPEEVCCTHNLSCVQFFNQTI